MIWAIASFIYVHLGKQMSPLVLNFTKTTIAVGLILFTLLLQGQVPAMPLVPFGVLFLSGVIGIGIGDTAFFESLNCVGARRSLLLEALAPPLTALLAALFLKEQLGVKTCFGIALTLAGVVWVVIERTPDDVESKFRPARGIGFGLLAAIAQASGSVLSRAALVGSDISPLVSTLSRLLGGVFVLIPLLILQPQLWQGLQALRSRRFLLVVTGTSFAGTYLAIWLLQTALKYTKAGIAQSLSATSPLFVIPLALWAGERVSGRAILGAFIALIGIWLLFDLS
ncbi:MAG: DMT family transporter [Elainellaceae cyanobacterium]